MNILAWTSKAYGKRQNHQVMVQPVPVQHIARLATFARTIYLGLSQDHLMHTLTSYLRLPVAMLVLFLAGLTSCIDNKCAKIDCGDLGTCFDGTCLCDLGYEGEDCKTEVRAKFIDYWHSENYGCNGLNGAILNFRIEPGAGITDVKIFFQSGSEVLIHGIVDKHVITIPLQNYGTTTMTGTITLLDNDMLDMAVKINNQITILTCSCQAMRV